MLFGGLFKFRIFFIFELQKNPPPHGTPITINWAGTSKFEFYVLN
jgi:hypothetical protein